MAQLNSNDLSVDSLLLPKDFTPEEKELHRSRMTAFLSEAKPAENSSTNHIVEIQVDDSLIASHEFEIKKLSNDQLSDLLREAPIYPYSSAFFPRIQHINELFWLLYHLAQKDVQSSKISFINQDQLSNKFYALAESAIFFGYLEKTIEDDEKYFTPTPFYKEWMQKPIADQYLDFLKILGSFDSISECIIIQLNDPIFDNISRQMVHKVLAKDVNIIKEELTNKEIDEIINNLRYWYLDIKKVILDE